MVRRGTDRCAQHEGYALPSRARTSVCKGMEAGGPQGRTDPSGKRTAGGPAEGGRHRDRQQTQGISDQASAPGSACREYPRKCGHQTPQNGRRKAGRHHFGGSRPPASGNGGADHPVSGAGGDDPRPCPGNSGSGDPGGGDGAFEAFGCAQ